MTATQTPQSTEAGAGRVVDATQTTQATTYKRQSKRRTNLLSLLSPAERKAFLQEQLDQSAIFRQIACAKNGVTGPIARNLIGDEPSEEEIHEESIRSGVSENEVRRREEIARREALVEVREEVLRQQEELAKKQAEKDAALVSAPATPPTPDPNDFPGISEADAVKREELAGKEAAIAVREQALKDQVAQAEKLKTANQATEAAIADRDRLQAERDRLEAEAKKNAENQTTPVPVTPPASPAVPPTNTEPAVTDTTTAKDDKFWTTPKVATATGLGGAALAGLVAWGMSGDPEITPTPDTGVPTTEVVDTDRETLLLLESRGLSAPRTPLGEKILEAFEKDPSLRERVMLDVEQTLLSE